MTSIVNKEAFLHNTEWIIDLIRENADMAVSMLSGGAQLPDQVKIDDYSEALVKIPLLQRDLVDSLNESDYGKAKEITLQIMSSLVSLQTWLDARQNSR